MSQYDKKGALNSASSNVVRFDEDKLDYKLPNDPQQEFFFNILEGLPPITQKRRILEGRLARCLSHQNCEILISALGLRGA